MRINFDMQLTNNLDKISKEVAIQTFQRSMQEIQNLAKINAAVDTGNLRNSIQLSIISDTKILITSFASYSAYIEFGTFKMNAQPFFRPAIDEVRFNKIKTIQKQVINSM